MGVDDDVVALLFVLVIFYFLQARDKRFPSSVGEIISGRLGVAGP